MAEKRLEDKRLGIAIRFIKHFDIEEAKDITSICFVKGIEHFMPSPESRTTLDARVEWRRPNEGDA